MKVKLEGFEVEGEVTEIASLLKELAKEGKEHFGEEDIQDKEIVYKENFTEDERLQGVVNRCLHHKLPFYREYKKEFDRPPKGHDYVKAYKLGLTRLPSEVNIPKKRSVGRPRGSKNKKRGRSYMRVTVKEQKKIIRMAKQGKSVAEIAGATRFTRKQIKIRLYHYKRNGYY